LVHKWLRLHGAISLTRELSLLLEQMTNANVTAEHTANTVIENTVNNQRKQNKHLGIKEDLHSLFGHIGSA